MTSAELYELLRSVKRRHAEGYTEERRFHGLVLTDEQYDLAVALGLADDAIDALSKLLNHFRETGLSGHPTSAYLLSMLDEQAERRRRIKELLSA